jgi:hypothetical protein
MVYLTFPCAVVGAAFALLLPGASAQAQNFQSFVATTGSNANDCDTSAAPCRTLSTAIGRTNSGGKVFMLDSGDFNGVPASIDKSISIVAVGADATLFTGALTKITINAGPDDVVYLDGLFLRRDVPTSGGTNEGIEFVRGGRLHVRNCTIRGFGRAGIFVRGPGLKRLFVSNCTVADNSHGIFINGTNNPVQAFLDRVTIEGNVSNGVRSQGSGARVRISNSVVANNGVGLNPVSGGRIISFGNNAVHGNGNNGAPTATVSPM